MGSEIPTVIEHFGGKHAFLSNFYPSPVWLGHLECPTVEHAYQAAKTENHELRAEIAATRTPGKAKRLGAKLEPNPDWDALRLPVMTSLLAQKFAVGSNLAAALLGTGEATLIEDNGWGDRFWGVCDGEGENHLGRLLTERRSELLRLAAGARRIA